MKARPTMTPEEEAAWTALAAVGELYEDTSKAMTRVCLTCQQEFRLLYSSAKQRYCSSRCWSDSAEFKSLPRRRPQPRPRPNCSRCGVPCKQLGRRFCSSRCATLVQWQLRRAA